MRILHAVFSGGGAKGAAYPGMYAAFAKTGVLSSIQKVSGTSAGASTAAFIAAGMNPHYFRQLLLSTNYQELLGKRDKKKLPSVSFITKDGKPLEDFIRNNFVGAFKETLKKSSFQESKRKNNAFESLYQKAFSSRQPAITFQDLKVCADLYPAYFKDLTVTAVTYPSGEPQIFNYEKTPHVEVAIACRASASLPVVLTPVEINGQFYIDGGLFDNLPDTGFSGIERRNTLLVAFGEGSNDKNAVYKALYGKNSERLYEPNLFEKFKRDMLPALFAGLELPYKNTDQKNKTYRKIQETYPLRTLELRTGKTKTTDFKQGQANARQLFALGYLDTINYIINHELVNDPSFKVDSFFTTLLEMFYSFFQKIQRYGEGSGKEAVLCQQLEALQKQIGGIEKEKASRELFYFIKEEAEKEFNSSITFSLTCAVELYNGNRSKSELDSDIINHREKTLKQYQYHFFSDCRPCVPEKIKSTVRTWLNSPGRH